MQPNAGVLFGISQAECGRLASFKGDEELLKTMRNSTDEKIKRLSAIIQDPVVAKQVVEALCAAP